MSKRIVISINAAWNIYNFRAGLVRALQAKGYEVIALAPEDEFSAKLSAMGVSCVPITIDNKGVSPRRDIALYFSYRKALKTIKPDVFLGYTIKPNIYGSMAAHSLGIPVINNISGLGTAFIRRTALTRIVQCLYKTALRRSRFVVFQNGDDRLEFLKAKLVKPAQTRLVPGSGIDLNAYAPSQSFSPNSPPVFLMIARLVWDKGVGEYIEAARHVKAQQPDTKFILLGFLRVANRTAVEREDVERWAAEGLIEYAGATDDVRPFITQADCIVLPSYREGTPRTLLEAASMGKPVITTDVPGCREVVDDGVNGYLCEVKNAEDLAAKMLRFSALSPSEKLAMGSAGRRKMETEFDEALVVNTYLGMLKAIV